MFKRFAILATVVLLMVCMLPAAGAEESVEQLHILYASSGFVLPDVENPIRDAIREETGIDIYMEPWYFNGDDELNNRLNLWVASAELPFDFFMGAGSTFAYSMFNMMGEAGLLRDWEPYILASESMTEFVAHTFPKYRNPNDGKVYMYPYHLNSVEMYGNLRDTGVSVRIDWLDELGLDAPANPEEFYAMLVAMKERYGIAPLSTSEGNLAKLAINFVGGYGTSSWEKDEEGVYRITMFEHYDRLSDFVLFCNRLWNEGLMDTESFTQKSEQLIEKLTASQAGVTTSLGHATQAVINDILWTENENALLAFVPSFPQEGVVPINTGVSNWGGGVVVANANVSDEKMQVYMDYCEWLLTKEGTVMTFMGVEGEHWAYNDEGLCEFLPEFVEQYPTENERQEYGLWHYQAPAASWFRIDQYAAPKPEYSRPDYSYSMAHCNDTVGLDDIVYAVVAGEEEQLRLPSIDDAWEQAFVKAVMAEDAAACQAILDAFPATLQSLGYDSICQERTELAQNIVLE